MMSVSDTGRYPAMVQNQNPEAGMLHAPNAPLADALATVPLHVGLLWLNQKEGQGTGESAHGIDVPSFDSEAHRKFMRSLG